MDNKRYYSNSLLYILQIIHWLHPLCFKYDVQHLLHQLCYCESTVQQRANELEHFSWCNCTEELDLLTVPSVCLRDSGVAAVQRFSTDSGNLHRHTQLTCCLEVLFIIIISINLYNYLLPACFSCTPLPSNNAKWVSEFSSNSAFISWPAYSWCKRQQTPSFMLHFLKSWLISK